MSHVKSWQSGIDGGKWVACLKLNPVRKTSASLGPRIVFADHQSINSINLLLFINHTFVLNLIATSLLSIDMSI